MARVVEVTFLRIFIQFIISIMDLVGPRKPEKAHQGSNAHKERHGRVRHGKKET